MKPSWGFTTLGHFPGNLLVSYQMPHKKLTAELKRKGWSDWATAIEGDEHYFIDCIACCLKRTVTNKRWGDRIMYIMTFNDPIRFTADDYVTIAHEVFHLTQFSFNHHRADVVEEKESAAYFHSHMMEQVINLLKKMNKK